MLGDAFTYRGNIALGCALVLPFPKKISQKRSTENQTTQGGKPKNGRLRLYTIIIMSKAVYLPFIWLLRDERRIQNNDLPGFTHSKEETRSRWYESLTRKLVTQLTVNIQWRKSCIW